MATHQKVWEQFETLTPDLQREVADFIDFLVSKAEKIPFRASRIRRGWREEHFVGMWEDRTDMADSSAWVRQQRKSEWGEQL